MKFLADINIPQSVISALINLDHDVLDIKRKNLAMKDEEIIELARKEKRIILTRDKDFILLTQFPKYKVATIAIRLKNQKPNHIRDRLLELLENQSEDTLEKSLTIINEESADSLLFERLRN